MKLLKIISILFILRVKFLVLLKYTETSGVNVEYFSYSSKFDQIN